MGQKAQTLSVRTWVLYPTGQTSLVAQMVKRLPTMWETWVQSLGREDFLERDMATHSSILVWRIPWMEEPHGLQSVGLQRVGHDWATSFSHSPGLVTWTLLASRAAGEGLAWWSSGLDSKLPMQKAQVWSLTGELISHTPHGIAKKKAGKRVFFFFFWVVTCLAKIWDFYY